MTRLISRIPAAVAVLLIAGSAAAQPVIALTQPGGAGDIAYSVTNAGANAELYNLVSYVPHTPTGSGPIFGLGVADSQNLLTQILLPMGAAPHHVAADAAGTYAWTVTLPPIGVTIDIDIVCVEFGTGGYVNHSSVLNTMVNL